MSPSCPTIIVKFSAETTATRAAATAKKRMINEDQRSTRNVLGTKGEPIPLLMDGLSLVNPTAKMTHAALSANS